MGHRPTSLAALPRSLKAGMGIAAISSFAELILAVDRILGKVETNLSRRERWIRDRRKL